MDLVGRRKIDKLAYGNFSLYIGILGSPPALSATSAGAGIELSTDPTRTTDADLPTAKVDHVSF